MRKHLQTINSIHYKCQCAQNLNKYIESKKDRVITLICDKVKTKQLKISKRLKILAYLG